MKCKLCKQNVADNCIAKIVHAVNVHPENVVKAIHKAGIPEMAFQIGNTLGKQVKGIK